MAHLSCGNRPLARCPNQPCCGGKLRKNPASALIDNYRARTAFRAIRITDSHRFVMPATKHRRKGRRRPGYTPLVVALPGSDELHDSMIADARLREVLGDDWL